MKRTFCILAAFSVLGCDDPAIRVPVEFEAARGRDLPNVETVMSVGFDGVHVAIEGMLRHYCEDFSAVASQWTDDPRSVVTLYVQSKPSTGVCNDHSSRYRYTASIEVQQPVTASLTAWEVRVYHRGTRLPVPPWGPAELFPDWRLSGTHHIEVR